METKTCFGITKDRRGRENSSETKTTALQPLSHALLLSLSVSVWSLYLSYVGLIFLSENQYDSKWPPHTGSLCLGIYVTSGKTTKEVN